VRFALAHEPADGDARHDHGRINMPEDLFVPLAVRFAARNALLFAVLILCAGLPAWAHNGPPFPIMEGKKIGPFTVAVWSNPDVGTGSFFVIIDSPPIDQIPDDLKVEVAVQPVSGRLPEAKYGAWREKLRDQVQYKTQVPFDKQEQWRVRVLLASSMGGGEAQTNVQVTPPGLGRWDLLLYLLPFLGIGLLWLKAVATKRERKKGRAAGPLRPERPGPAN
jgi:hypothetical protein